VIYFSDHPGEVRDFVHKRLLKAAGGFLSGGPVGAISGFVAPTRKAKAGVFAGGQLTPARLRLNAKRARQQAAARGGIGIIPATKKFFMGPPSPALAAAGPAGGGCPQGFHPNKSSYMTKGGFVQKHSRCVRNRRRNLSNGRANTRAMRRMAAWDKQDRRLGSTLKKIARGR